MYLISGFGIVSPVASPWLPEAELQNVPRTAEKTSKRYKIEPFLRFFMIFPFDFSN
jgi:hypothetical protein